MSEFTCPVVRIKAVRKHPNADTLSITEVDGEQVVIKTGAFNEGDLAIYIPIDAVVPTDTPIFAFLAKEGKTTHRIKAARLRGVYSEGLLVPHNLCPADFPDGKDCAEALRVKKYEEPINGRSGVKLQGNGPGEQAKNLDWAPVYSVEKLAKYRDRLSEYPEVVVTEKLHGSNFRAVYADGELHVGSHYGWRRALYKGWGKHPVKRVPLLKRLVNWLAKPLGKQPFDVTPINTDIWWKIAVKYNLAEKLKKWPGVIIYGEVFGDVQDLKYGHERGAISLRIFDAYISSRTQFIQWVKLRSTVFSEEEWIGYDALSDLCARIGVEMPPVLYIGPYDQQKVDHLCGGKSILDNNTIREGIVVRSYYGSRHHTSLKLISEEYKLRKNGTEYH